MGISVDKFLICLGFIVEQAQLSFRNIFLGGGYSSGTQPGGNNDIGTVKIFQSAKAGGNLFMRTIDIPV